MAAAVQVHQDISKMANRLKRHVEGWRKYSDIWKADRVTLLDKFKAKVPPTSAFEEKFAKFQKVIAHQGCSSFSKVVWCRWYGRGFMVLLGHNKLLYLKLLVHSCTEAPLHPFVSTRLTHQALSHYCVEGRIHTCIHVCCCLHTQQAVFFCDLAHDMDVGCVRVSNGSLALAVHEECCAWTRSLAAVMRELDVAAVTALRVDIAAKHAVLQQTPEDLAQLKAVLHVINAIRWGGRFS